MRRLFPAALLWLWLGSVTGATASMIAAGGGATSSVQALVGIKVRF